MAAHAKEPMPRRPRFLGGATRNEGTPRSHGRFSIEAQHTATPSAA
ncbi:hypothetical protein ACGFY7_49015 [Streptomyces prunicolor]